MQIVETSKTGGQVNFAGFRQKEKAQSGDFKTWGMTAGSALVGAVMVATTTQGILSLLALLATPPVALTVGALSGGFMGWNYMRQRQMSDAGARPTTVAPCSPMDDLELINGVSATYAAHLHAAGIHTFAQLAELMPERVHLIIGPTDAGLIIQSERWIAEARQFAEQRKRTIVR